jgi:hypothetical protein
MKKIVAIIAFLALVYSTVSAQGEVRFGFQLSPAFGWLSTDDNLINGNGTNLGLKLGMVGEYYFQENYSITSGIGFHFNAGGTLLHDRPGVYWINSEKPNACVESFQQPGSNLKYSVQYVEIPIGLKMRTREFGYVRYFMEPQLGFGFRTQAEGDVRNQGDECNDINIQDDVGLLNLFWGVNGGIEYSVSESTSLVGGLGLQFGFTDLTKDDDLIYTDNNLVDTRSEDSKGVMRAIILRLGVMF